MKYVFLEDWLCLSLWFVDVIWWICCSYIFCCSISFNLILLYVVAVLRLLFFKLKIRAVYIFLTYVTKFTERICIFLIFPCILFVKDFGLHLNNVSILKNYLYNGELKLCRHFEIKIDQVFQFCFLKCFKLLASSYYME